MDDSCLLIANETEMRQLACHVADQAKAQDLLYLKGDLGMGKSLFARAFIQHLAQEKIDIPSPTFTLVQSYENLPIPVWHFDLYRLQNAGEIDELGIEEALSFGITLIEWPERLGAARFIPTLTLEISPGPQENQRYVQYFISEQRNPCGFQKLNAFKDNHS